MDERLTIIDHEEYLRQISKEVDFNDSSIENEVNALKEYCQNHVVFAMAAVQIGIPKRIIYLKNTTEDYTKNEDATYDETKVLINPIIIKTKGLTRYLESCASCPATKEDLEKSEEAAKYLSCVVERPYIIEVEYFNQKGIKQLETFKGFEATVLAHELDHLDGRIHIDLSDEIFALNLKERIAYREAHPYEIISEE